MKYHAWASAMAISLCLTGIAGCGGGSNEQPTAAEGNVQTVEVQVNGETDEIDINVEEIANAYRAYSDSIETDLIAPLRVIAKTEEVDRTEDLIASSGFAPAAVNSALDTFLTSLSSVITIEAQYGEDFKTEAKGTLDLLRTAEDAAEEIKETIVIPLLLEEFDLPPAELFISSENRLSDDERRRVIRTIQENIPPVDGNLEEDRVTYADSIGASFVGRYGGDSFEAIDSFVGNKNVLIEDSVNELAMELSVLPPSAESRTGAGLFASVALLLGLANLSGMCFLFYLLKRGKNVGEEENSAMDIIASNQDDLKRESGNLNKFSSKVERLQSDCDFLKRENDQLHHKVASIESKLNQLDVHNHQKSLGNVDQSFGTRVAAPRDQSHVATQTISSAETYNQDSRSFTKVETVALSKASQEKLWVGKKVTPMFSQSSQGDYWVITQDSQTFYLVIKDDAPINENNLETLGIIYQFENRSNLSSLRRQYSKLAEIMPQGNEWLLKQSGSLVFY